MAISSEIFVFFFQGLHADKLHSCDFDCNIPQHNEIVEPRLASMAGHEEATSGTDGEENLIPEAVNEHAAIPATAHSTAPESHSLNSCASPSICHIHSILLLLISIILS